MGDNTPRRCLMERKKFTKSFKTEAVRQMEKGNRSLFVIAHGLESSSRFFGAGNFYRYKLDTQIAV
jgi:hypothetical protein